MQLLVVVASLFLMGCEVNTQEQDEEERLFNKICSEDGMLDETNRAKWLELTATIDRGEIRREQVSMAPLMPSFSSGDRSSLEARVEASVGAVVPVAGSNSNDDSALFQGPLVVLLDGERLLELRNFYLASDRGDLTNLYGQDTKIRSCFLEAGNEYLTYIGRQK